MSSPLIVSEKLLKAHFGDLEAILTSNIDVSRTHKVRLVADWNVVPLVVGLVGGAKSRHATEVRMFVLYRFFSLRMDFGHG